MAEPFTIVALCAGNIHRSALAAALLERWAQWYLPPALRTQVVIASAGFHAPEGEPMSDEVLSLATGFGADGSTHRATMVSDDALAGASLILTATRRQLEEVIRRAPGALRLGFTMREAGRAAQALADPPAPRTTVDLRNLVASLADARTPSPDDDVIDPQGLEESAYVQMTVEEVPALARLAHVLFGMPRPDLNAYLAAVADEAGLSERISSARVH